METTSPRSICFDLCSNEMDNQPMEVIAFRYRSRQHFIEMLSIGSSMGNEIPWPIVRIAESLGGSLVAGREEVSDHEIIVAVSCSHSSTHQVSATVVFTFLDEVTRKQFRDSVMRSYEDERLFESWKVNEYLSQPAADYFKRSGGGGASGSQLLSVKPKNG